MKRQLKSMTLKRMNGMRKESCEFIDAQYYNTITRTKIVCLGHSTQSYNHTITTIYPNYAGLHSVLNIEYAGNIGNAIGLDLSFLLCSDDVFRIVGNTSKLYWRHQM